MREVRDLRDRGFKEVTLLGQNVNITDWNTADFCRDNKLDIFDLCQMKKALIQEADIPVAVSIRQSGGVAGSDVLYEVYQKDEKYILSFTNFTSSSSVFKPVPNVFIFNDIGSFTPIA